MSKRSEPALTFRTPTAGTLRGSGPLKKEMLKTKVSLKAVSVIEAVARSIRERILNGELPPDTVLPEFALSDQYDVARPTIRAALQQLALTGLIRRAANRSAFVPRLNREEILDLFSVRRLVETEVVRRVTENRVRPERAEAALRRLELFTQDAKWSDVVEADLEIHRALVAATNSPRLLRAFELLEDEIRLCIAQLKPAYESPAALAREHRDLLTAIENGDKRTAIALMGQHLDQAIGDLTETRTVSTGKSKR